MTGRVDRNGPGVQLSYDGGCRARFFICSLLCNGMYICRVMSGPGIIMQFFDFEMTRHRLFRNCELYSFHCSSVTAECSPPPGGRFDATLFCPRSLGPDGGRRHRGGRLLPAVRIMSIFGPHSASLFTAILASRYHMCYTVRNVEVANLRSTVYPPRLGNVSCSS